jgi:hypothetical protein
MAVELCKVGLWMEAVEPGLPLTFLNSHIQHGCPLSEIMIDLDRLRSAERRVLARGVEA